MEEEEEEKEKEEKEKAIVRSAPDGSDNNWYIFAHKGDIGQSTM